MANYNFRAGDAPHPFNDPLFEENRDSRTFCGLSTFISATNYWTQPRKSGIESDFTLTRFQALPSTILRIFLFQMDVFAFSSCNTSRTQHTDAFAAWKSLPLCNVQRVAVMQVQQCLRRSLICILVALKLKGSIQNCCPRNVSEWLAEGHPRGSIDRKIVRAGPLWMYQ